MADHAGNKCAKPMKHLSKPRQLALRGVLIRTVEATNGQKIQGPECESREHAAASNQQGWRKAGEPQVRCHVSQT